jgi:CO dehydrogenase nickel-insertion accessory protein CooC1
MNATQQEAIEVFAKKNGLSVMALIPFDAKVTEADMLGETPLKHKELDAVRAIDNISEALIKRVSQEKSD